MTAGLPRVITSVRSLLPLRRCDRFYTAAAYADCSHDFAVEPQRDAAWEGDQEETGTTVADLVEVSDLNSGFAGVREMRAFAMGKGADDAEFEFQPAVQTVSGQVTVRFSLKTVSF